MTAPRVGSPRQRPAEREGEGGSDGRDPPVSDRVRGGSARAAPAWAERERVGLRANFPATRCIVLFFFFFLWSFLVMFDFV